MTRETKVGLLMVVMLVGVFGFMVYKKMHRPSEALADHRETVAPENEEEVRPFAGSGDTGDGMTAGAGRVVTVGAAAPEAIPENTTAVRVESREADPFEVSGRPTANAKPNLPTSIPGDDAFFDAQPQTTAAAEPRASTAETAAPAAAFDPFMQESTPSSRTNVVANPGNNQVESSSESPSVAAESDPFEAPLEVSPSAAPVAAQPVAQVPVPSDDDPFEAAPRTTTSSGSGPTLAAPTAAPKAETSDPFELVEEPSRSVPTPTAPALTAPVFESPPANNAPAPTLAPQPTRATESVPDEERLGGFRPVEVNTRSANEFSRDARPTPTAIPATDPFGAARRPAPAARIDEDFAPRATAQPLVPGDTYNIEPSDNFWTISRKKYGTGRYFMALSQHNLAVIPDPKRMKPGVTISTPATDVLEKNYPTLIPKAAPAESVATIESSAPNVGPRRAPEAIEEDAGFFVSNDGMPMYRVGSEDTLSGIAKSHLGRSSRWVQIFEMNRDTLTDGNTLKVGTLLRLPGDASRVDVVGAPRAIR